VKKLKNMPEKGIHVFWIFVLVYGGMAGVYMFWQVVELLLYR